jgi:HK97 family phage portal protein
MVTGALHRVPVLCLRRKFVPMKFNIWSKANAESRTITNTDSLNTQVPGGLFSNVSAIWQFLSGGNSQNESNEPVNDSTAMGISTIFTCLKVLSGSIASLACRVYSQSANGTMEDIDAPLTYLLQVEANPETSSFSFIETFMVHLLLRGNAYAQIQRNASGDPIALWNLDPRKTEPVRLGVDNELAFRTTDAMVEGQSRIIAKEDMLHVLSLSWDGISGVSPITALRQTLGLAIGQQKFTARMLKNNAVPQLALTTEAKMKPEDKMRMRSDWEGLQGGSSQGRVAIMDNGLTVQKLGMSAEDSELLASRVFSRAEIAAAMGVPASMVGDLTRLSNSNHEQQSLTFVQDSLTPLLKRIEIEFKRKLLPRAPNGKPNNSYIKFDLRERLRSDFETTMAGYAVGKQWGFYSTNDVRRELGENPIGPEGDVYWYPTNMGNSAQLLNQANTEPITQQPIGADIARHTLGLNFSQYRRLYRDAVGRLADRPVEKRDLATVKRIFEPVVSAIADLSAESAYRSTDAPEWQHEPAKHIAEYMQKLTERSAVWQLGDLDSIAVQELKKVTRAITLAAHRSIAEFAALKGLAHAA